MWSVLLSWRMISIWRPLFYGCIMRKMITLTDYSLLLILICRCCRFYLMGWNYVFRGAYHWSVLVAEGHSGHTFGSFFGKNLFFVDHWIFYPIYWILTNLCKIFTLLINFKISLDWFLIELLWRIHTLQLSVALEVWLRLEISTRKLNIVGCWFLLNRLFVSKVFRDF